MRKVYILPNLFTAGSLFCGMLAIFEILGSYIQDNAPSAVPDACFLILISALLDVCDGAVARLTRSASFFGLNFDSLSDLVAFGVAPAILAFSACWAAYPRLAAAVCSLYTICGALRLARFNVQATREEKKSFHGLPIPGAALAAISLTWLFDANPALAAHLPKETILPPAMVVLAYLMVSKVPFYGLKSINFGGRQHFEILVTIVVIACLIFLLKQHLDVVLAAVAWSYVLISAAVGLLQHPAPVPDEAPLSAPPSSPSRPNRTRE